MKKIILFNCDDSVLKMYSLSQEEIDGYSKDCIKEFATKMDEHYLMKKKIDGLNNKLKSNTTMEVA